VKPVALVTGEVSPYRREPFRMLAEAEGVEVLAFREAAQVDPAAAPPHGLLVHHTTERGAVRRIASGRYRAVIAGIGGRVALPGSYLAARRTRIPFVLWTSLWAHPRTPAHLLSWLPTRHLYAHADAVVTYGRHVTSYVERHRSAGNVFEAPQAVSAELFGTLVDTVPNNSFRLLFVGRLEREKGIEVLLGAWRAAGLRDDARLVFAGAGPIRPEGPGVEVLGRVAREQLPPLYASADALVLPSIRTATFLEPWGLVVNEAMHQGTPVIASDAVGAVAGGLVQDGRNGLVAPAGDAQTLATRIRTLAKNPELVSRLGAAASEDVKPFSEAAWVEGMRRALHAVGAGRGTR
jgi:glycosyltransferase involved in cell wall biosynthesis